MANAGDSDRELTMSFRIFAVLASSGGPATIGAVVDRVSRGADDQMLALMVLGGLMQRKLVAFVDEYDRDVPLANLRVRLVPFDNA